LQSIKDYVDPGLVIFFSGNYSAKFINKLKLGNKPTIVAGVLMILIGISQFFD